MKIIKITENHLFPYCFPPEGNLDIDAGDAGSRGPFKTPQIPPNLPTSQTKIFRTKIVHTSGTFFEQSQQSQKNTHNHIKITIHNAKHTKNAKIYVQQIDVFRFISKESEKNENL